MSGGAILALHEARVAFADRGRPVYALNGVSAAIAPGTVTAIAGPNGAGKTTFLRAAAGLFALDAGACVFHDRALDDWPREALARRIAYLPQGGESAWPLTAREIAMLGRLPHGVNISRPSRADADAVERALARAGVAHLAGRRLDRLSAGERGRVLLARALATEADLLLADEPAAHLDPAHQLRLMEILAEEAARGAAVVVTLHELVLAARADRVLVLDGGRIAADGPPDEALSDAILARIFSVEAIRRTDADGTALVPWRRLR